MQDTILTIYCLCANLLQALAFQDDPQVQLSTAEVLTVPLVAAAFFGGNLNQSRQFLHEQGYCPQMLSESRLNRRLHAVPTELWQTLFGLLGQVFKAHNASATYVVDSLPVPVCDNIRIQRCKLLRGEAHRGYIASKRRYFYGLRVHLLVTATGEPVEFVLAPGATADIEAFKEFALDLPLGSTIYADKAYNDYTWEDVLHAAGLTLQPQRKKNSKRPLSLCLEFMAYPVRKRIETSFSQLTARFPKHIHAVTPQGFVLKVVCFLLAFSIECLLR
ncbi:MAG: IS982 family transposase [Abitibacteriaceae bacterium]|nr:IS982 family transposase [Abditibacteriaceae bacterium]